jgi:hypothetical protein
VLIGDMAVERYEKRFMWHAPSTLEVALDRLGRVMG